MNSIIRNTLLFLLAAFSLPASADFTHLNVDHREIVHLSFQFGADSLACTGFSGGAFKLVQTSGNLANNEFKVPAGKELIITDVTWEAVPSPAPDWIPNSALAARISIYNDTGTFNGRLLRLPLVNPPDDENSYFGGAVNLTAGARVASRRILCPAVSQIFPNGSNTSSIRFMDLFGYLIDKAK